MAVGKGSMERAAKTAAAGAAEKSQAVEKKAPAKKAAAKSAVKANTTKAVSVIPAPTEEVMEKIVYQTSSGMLERDAEPNESFGLGDAMPVYYF